MPLKDLEIGKSGIVLTIDGEKPLRRRLLEMEITPRTIVTVKKLLPWGTP
ncbi:MAG: FeoA domain-containing protein [Treponema sp.]|jgi:Fe2+ transport system protein FeoA|nr:FeoA domain-containing protein [Treponema sp.]